MVYKIAVVTEDGQQISSHFGMAPLYQVFSIEDGQVTGEEARPKAHHARHPQPAANELLHPEHSEHTSREAHGSLHADMFAPLADCKVLLAGGMGQPAYQNAQSLGLEVILTGGSIQTGVAAYLRGEAQSDPRRVHHHR